MEIDQLSSLVLAAVAAAEVAVAAVSVALFLRFRNNLTIRKRLPWLTVFSAVVLQIAIAARSAILYLASRGFRLPCYVISIPFFGFTFYLGVYFIKAANFITVYYLEEEALDVNGGHRKWYNRQRIFLNKTFSGIVLFVLSVLPFVAIVVTYFFTNSTGCSLNSLAIAVVTIALIVNSLPGVLLGLLMRKIEDGLFIRFEYLTAAISHVFIAIGLLATVLSTPFGRMATSAALILLGFSSSLLALLFPVYLASGRFKLRFRPRTNLENRNAVPEARSPHSSILSFSGLTLGLNDVLQLGEGLESFKKFLVKEFSVENLFFYMQVEKLMQNTYPVPSIKQTLTTMDEILAQYIIEGAPYQINISSDVRTLILKEAANLGLHSIPPSFSLNKQKLRKSVVYKENDLNISDDAVSAFTGWSSSDANVEGMKTALQEASVQAFNLMLDSFSRFKKTDDYARLNSLTSLHSSATFL